MLGCSSCHGGDPKSGDMCDAHEGMNPYPSSVAHETCVPCHSDKVETYSKSIHATLKGIENWMYAATSSSNRTTAKAAFDKYCYHCHASCGTCHVSKPQVANRGLIDGHAFSKSHDEFVTCGACHGGRVANEFRGGIEGFPGDVHYQKLGFTCTSCHDGQAFHGDGTEPANRFEVASKPACLSCHPNEAPGKSKIPAHNAHAPGTLDCYVCHATVNTSCYSCHVGEGATAKVDFKIGLNTRPNWPYKYSVVRHMPTVRTMLDPFAPGLLENFDSIPNWRTSMVHNIQRITPRNRTCQSCHNNTRIFLNESHLVPEDSPASRSVLVPSPPPRR